MSRRVRIVGAGLALWGLLGTSALAGVTALHLLLEHHGHHDTVAHTHGVRVRTPTDRAHPHAPGAAVPRHSQPSPHDLHHSEAPNHDHVLVLTADLQPRPDRPWTRALAHLHADATPRPAPGAVLPPLWQPSRAGPAARAAPLSRRFVVLRV